VLILVASASPAFAQSETVEYYGLDTLGSVRVIFDQQGNLVGRMDYGPFGENLRAASRFPRRQFAGLERDTESGQDYAQARSYSTGTGRFNQIDPEFAGLYNPQKWNRYTYALNCPLTYADANGRDPYAVGLLGAYYIWPRAVGGQWDTGVTADTQNVSLLGADGVFVALSEETLESIGSGGSTQSSNTSVTENDPKPPTDNCREFAEELTRLTRRLSGQGLAVINGAGWNMMWYANESPDHWDGIAYAGFRKELVEPQQGDDVYRHVYGHAGAALAWETGGAFVHTKELNKDLDQVRTNHPGAVAEAKGSMAGYEVGKIMRRAALWGTYNWSSVKAQITKVICQ
jgi:RHS repeat-associated protein